MSEQSVRNCTRCVKPISPGETCWPDDGNGTLCQDCWEAYSSSLWWEMLGQLPGLQVADDDGEDQ